MEQVVPVALFWESMLCGALIVLAYDWIRILRRIIGHSRLWCILEDLFFLVICFFLLFYLWFLKYNSGPRVIWYLALLLGMGIYWAGISRPLMAILSRVIFASKKGLKKARDKLRMNLEKSLEQYRRRKKHEQKAKT